MKDQREYVALDRLEDDDDDEQHLLSTRKAHSDNVERKSSRSTLMIFVITAGIISLSLLLASISIAWKNSSLMYRINQLSDKAIELSNVKHGQDFPPPSKGFIAATEIAALNKNPPHKWKGNNGLPKQTVAPVSIDIIDDTKPDEVIKLPENVYINNNVSLSFQLPSHICIDALRCRSPLSTSSTLLQAMVQVVIGPCALSRASGLP